MRGGGKKPPRYYVYGYCPDIFFLKGSLALVSYKVENPASVLQVLSWTFRLRVALPFL